MITALIVFAMLFFLYTEVVILKSSPTPLEKWTSLAFFVFIEAYYIFHLLQH
jgi:hypothetical protein